MDSNYQVSIFITSLKRLLSLFNLGGFQSACFGRTADNKTVQFDISDIIADWQDLLMHFEFTRTFY